MTMPTNQPDKWQEQPGVTKVEVTEGLSELFGIPAEDIKGWTIVIHVSSDTEHASRTASSHDDADAIASMLMQGLMAL